jgi:hypothetical protein
LAAGVVGYGGGVKGGVVAATTPTHNLPAHSLIAKGYTSLP